MKRIAITALLVLAGCAGQNYIRADMSVKGRDLLACKKQATDTFFAHHGTLAFGAIGGLVTAAQIHPDEMQQQVDACMAARGYSRAL